MKFLLLLLAILPLLAKPAPIPKLLVIGHAGSGFFTPISPFNFRPPSSWQGIKHALDIGTDGVEIDLQLSQDSVVMLYHDPQLDYRSNGKGCVSQHPAAYLTQLRYHGGFPYDLFQNERPITFDTLLARLNRRPVFPHLHLDLHEDDDCARAGQQQARMPALVRQIAASLARYHVPPARILFTTQQKATLQAARSCIPAVRLGLEIVADTPEGFATGIRLAQAEKVEAVVLDADRITPEQSAQAHAAGLRVVIFGGRSPKNLRQILLSNPDEMEVDNSRRLLKMQNR